MKNYRFLVMIIQLFFSDLYVALDFFFTDVTLNF